MRILTIHLFNFLLIAWILSAPTIADENSIVEYERSPELMRSIEKQMEKFPESQIGAPKYGLAGHEVATYIVAVTAGIKKERALKLAYFAQFPDNREDFSAMGNAFNLLEWEYRKQIMATLHSLHGGDHEAVIKRRNDLKSVLKEAIKNGTLTDAQIGLVVHSYADSYAHTEEDELGVSSAYGYVFGHIFHGHEPDTIAYYPDKFKDYACNLYIVFSLKDNCRPALEEFFYFIDELKTSRKNALSDMMIEAEQLGFDNEILNAMNTTWEKEINREQLEQLMTTLEGKFQCD